ncbi:transcription elongation factor GreAB [Luteolibacter luteus]|uniref:Transcription elongation factor GreAB n=1 Tax=Luteolibacter luteus TaxID=2728835 RepID=A0A858RMQ6_9BACT|nr:transcription elongation factor GreAB [Luteolibacter luteus]QJE97738.1 transcription elongation factor GreAB [Luteolibacter luteus]
MKERLLDLIRAELRSRFDRLSRAAKEAHAAATDPGSKAEGKYDTRSLEASYLATGQARQVEELAQDVAAFEAATLRDFGPDDEIEAGALVEVDLDGESSWFLLAPAAGGLELEWEGRDITLLAPSSALYGRLLGMKMGDSAENPALFVSEVM